MRVNRGGQPMAGASSGIDARRGRRPRRAEARRANGARGVKYGAPYKHARRNA